MRFIRTLSAVGQEEPHTVGFRAKDLGTLHEHKFALPQCFVLTSEAFSSLVAENNLKYKIDYILRHVTPKSPQSYVNAYTSIRRIIKEAQLPTGLETELKEMFEGLTSKGIGMSGPTNKPLRIILSMNLLTDPENNDTIIQNIRGWQEFMIAIREAWALAYHAKQLKPRLDTGFSEGKLKISMIIQEMDTPEFCSHVHSILPHDRERLYVQTYYGHLDLRERVAKDYFAIAREGLRLLLTDIKAQQGTLEFDENGELVLAVLKDKTEHDKVIDRDVQEISRLTKKAERVLGYPLKAFFSTAERKHALLWVNRLGFDLKMTDVQPEEEYVEIQEPETPVEEASRPVEPIQPIQQNPEPIPEPEPEPIPTPEPFSEPEPAIQVEPEISVSEPELASVETPTPTTVREEEPEPESTQPATPDNFPESVKQAVQLVEKKYYEILGADAPKERVSRMIKNLNRENAFSRPLDHTLIGKANRAVNEEGFDLTPEEQAQAQQEITFLFSQ